MLSPSLENRSLSEVQIAIGLFLVAYIFIFLFVVSRDWVKTVADAYSRNLIEAINA